MAAKVFSAVFFGIFVKNNNLVFHSQVEFNAAELFTENKTVSFPMAEFFANCGTLWSLINANSVRNLRRVMPATNDLWLSYSV